MKPLAFLTSAFLAFVLVGCDLPDADFSTSISVIEGKSQDKYQAGNHTALYTIRSYNGGKYCYKVKILMPEDFAQVNQHIYFNGTNMFAGPMELESTKNK